MKISPTQHPEVVRIIPEVFEDERGFFMETYQQKIFADFGIPNVFVQDNHSSSRLGTLRGLHYQISHPQGKLVRVVIGEVFDVAVDIRKGSSRFGEWVGVTLSEENKHMLWVPPGFAHGFYVLSELADVLYKTTDYYDAEGERCIYWNDPQLAIDWHLAKGVAPILSQKDAAGVRFAEAEVFE